MSRLHVIFDLDDTLYPERQFAISGFRAAGAWAKAELGVDGLAEEMTGLLEAGMLGRIFSTVLERHAPNHTPEHVKAAASQVARPSGSSLSPLAVKPNRFLGAPGRIIVERMVDGETSEEDYPTLVDEIRMTIGNVGQTSTLGRSLAWRTVIRPTR